MSQTNKFINAKEMYTYWMLWRVVVWDKYLQLVSFLSNFIRISYNYYKEGMLSIYIHGISVSTTLNLCGVTVAVYGSAISHSQISSNYCYPSAWECVSLIYSFYYNFLIYFLLMHPFFFLSYINFHIYHPQQPTNPLTWCQNIRHSI